MSKVTLINYYYYDTHVVLTVKLKDETIIEKYFNTEAEALAYFKELENDQRRTVN